MLEINKSVYEEYDKIFSEMDERTRREYWATLAIRHCPGLGIKNSGKLLRHYGTAKDAYDDCNSWAHIGIHDNIIRELNRGHWRKKAEREWNNAKRLNCNILLWSDSAYPNLLKQLIDPPLILYYLGRIELLQSPCIAIVGSRKASERSLQVASSLARSLSSCGITIVSGMARGIDCYAHSAALERIGSSIGVLGTGIDYLYPSDNRKTYEAMYKKGLILTEFAPETPPLSYNFPIRNRIISGLSLGVVVVEAAEKSGSLVTARIALEQNREVFAVPGPALNNRSRGCQNLIRNGAHLVFCMDDILQNLKYALHEYTIDTSGLEVILEQEENRVINSDSINYSQKAKEKNGSAFKKEAIIEGNKVAKEYLAQEPAELILKCLQKRGAMHIDALAEEMKKNITEINSALVLLEMLGRIKRLDGARYEINI